MSGPDIAPSFGRLVRQLRDRFERAGIETAAMDARLLVAHAGGLNDAGLIVRENEPVDGDIVTGAEGFAQRRLAGEPVARIVGEKEFYGLAFTLGADTLVPRPETELLVEAGLAHLAGRPAPRFLELGTGSGAVAVAIATHCPAATGLATDNSAGALETARANADLYGVSDRLQFALGDWYVAVPVDERFDLIVCNPPYIETAEIAELDKEVRLHDPIGALDGGADGLAALRTVIAGAPNRLSPGGMLAVEIGASQGAAVSMLMDEAGLQSVAVRPDLAGLDRVASGRRSGD